MSNVSGFDVLLRFLHILVSKKKTVLLITLVPTLICVVAMVFTKSTYRAQAVIKPPVNQSSSPLDAALKGSGAEGLLGSFLGGSETGANDCMSILKSVLFAELVIKRFDLETLYEFKRNGTSRNKYYFADVVDQFEKKAKFETSEEDDISISMEDESPERAKEMVAFMIQTLDSLYTDIQRTATKRRLEYVDGRLTLAESEMKGTEDSLVAFQNRHNLLIPEAQVRMILENATQTEIQVENVKQDLALEAALRGTSSPRYHDLSVQKDLLQQSLQAHLRNHTDSNTLMLPARTLPTLANEYFRLQRAYTVKLSVYKYLVQQVETLKLEANKNIQVISILDPPWNNDKRVAPKKRIFVESVFIVFFLIGSLFAVLQTLWEKRKQENPETLALFLETKKNLFKF